MLGARPVEKVDRSKRQGFERQRRNETRNRKQNNSFNPTRPSLCREEAFQLCSCAHLTSVRMQCTSRQPNWSRKSHREREKLAYLFQRRRTRPERQTKVVIFFLLLRSLTSTSLSLLFRLSLFLFSYLSLLQQKKETACMRENRGRRKKERNGA